jgi:hypothetical protein
MDDFDKLLAMVPDVDPDPHDRIPTAGEQDAGHQDLTHSEPDA